MISVDGEETLFPEKVKNRTEIVWRKLLKAIIKRDLLNLTEANQQINMTSDHSFSSNTWF